MFAYGITQKRHWTGESISIGPVNERQACLGEGGPVRAPLTADEFGRMVGSWSPGGISRQHERDSIEDRR